MSARNWSVYALHQSVGHFGDRMEFDPPVFEQGQIAEDFVSATQTFGNQTSGRQNQANHFQQLFTALGGTAGGWGADET